MRSDLIGMPVVYLPAEEQAVFVVRALWIEGEQQSGQLVALLEDAGGRLLKARSDQFRMLVPQVLSSHSATSLLELFPDLLMEFGRHEIMAIWTLAAEGPGSLRERLEYGVWEFRRTRRTE